MILLFATKIIDVVGFANYINKISRITNKLWMITIALLISILLLQEDPNSQLVILLWAGFIFISLIFSLNGVLLKRSFNKEIEKFMIEGKPVRGIQGFDELVEALNASMVRSLLISLASILSFIVYYITIGTGIVDIGATGKTLSISMVFLAVSVVFLVEYPKDTSFTPGGMIGFFEPDVFPLQLDNLLTDVFMTYIDPATFLKIDEWSLGILSYLIPEFENDEDQPTRLERAREKILLLAYLSYSNPIAFSDEVIKRELEELFGNTNYQKFVKGENTGLTWNEVTDIVERIEDKAPEPFRLVDRLLISITDNYEKFKGDDLYFTVSAKSNQGSVIESTGIIVFFLNLTSREDREVTVQIETDERSIHPASQKVTFTLDNLTDPFPSERPPLVGEGYDCLSLLSTLLQVGDGVWFRLQPSGFGYRVVAIQAHETGGKIMGQTFEMRFTKSISWYLKSYLPKLSALGSVAFPVLGPIIGIK